MSIGSILTGKKPLISVTTTTSVREIAALLHANRIGAVLVVEDNSILGIVSERDIVAALHEQGAAVLDAAAGTVMTARVVTATPETSIIEAMGVMTDRRIRHLPVLSQGSLLGLVSIGDLVKRRIDDAEAEAVALKDYIQTA
ncbi:CBS domain-containing protein [Glacieibacterium sp.]|uniref:CBS domain-containing protein n=1 Tax=Glacieibacterium sp. TaxID=2860237 RepID=UPI003AFFE0B2